MHRRLLITSTCLAAVVAAPAATAWGDGPSAHSAQRSSSRASTLYPTVTRITPMRAGLGDTLTIRGRNFVPGRNRNTVVFKRDGQPAVFVRAASATRTRLTVVVSDRVGRYLRTEGGTPVPTRFRLRILARRFGRAFTPLNQSPTITPNGRVAPAPGAPGAAGTPGAATAPPAPAARSAEPAPAPAPAPAPDCDRDGSPDGADADDDNDLLSDAYEAELQTNACLADTDGDGLEDAWEVESAIDLNARARPYPGERPFPNAADPSDTNEDHDGDGLLAWQEHRLWQVWGARRLPLNYSGGTQRSQGDVPASGQPAQLDWDTDGVLEDDEMDADGDGLGNHVEAGGSLLNAGWWSANYATEQPYWVVYRGTDFANRDSDGDGVADGADDQDFDGFTNIQETRRLTSSRPRYPFFMHPDQVQYPGGGVWVQPFNPCLPNPESPTCGEHVPADIAAPPPYDTFGVPGPWLTEFQAADPALREPLPWPWNRESDGVPYVEPDTRP